MTRGCRGPGGPGEPTSSCWAAIVLSGIYYWAMLPFRAELVGTHPVLGELLNGSTESIIAAAAFARVGHGTLVVVLLAAVPGLMKFDVIYWFAGRLWGERLILLLSGKRNRGVKYMSRVQRWGRKFTWPAVLVSQFLPIPTAIIYAVAGWAGMQLVTFLILDAIGSLRGRACWLALAGSSAITQSWSRRLSRTTACGSRSPWWS